MLSQLDFLCPIKIGDFECLDNFIENNKDIDLSKYKTYGDFCQLIFSNFLMTVDTIQFSLNILKNSIINLTADDKNSMIDELTKTANFISMKIISSQLIELLNLILIKDNNLNKINILKDKISVNCSDYSRKETKLNTISKHEGEIDELKTNLIGKNYENKFNETFRDKDINNNNINNDNSDSDNNNEISIANTPTFHCKKQRLSIDSQKEFLKNEEQEKGNNNNYPTEIISYTIEQKKLNINTNNHDKKRKTKLTNKTVNNENISFENVYNNAYNVSIKQLLSAVKIMKENNMIDFEERELLKEKIITKDENFLYFINKKFRNVNNANIININEEIDEKVLIKRIIKYLKNIK